MKSIFDVLFMDFSGRQIPLTHQYAAVLCLCIPLLIIVKAGSAIFWILGK